MERVYCSTQIIGAPKYYYDDIEFFAYAMETAMGGVNNKLALHIYSLVEDYDV